MPLTITASDLNETTETQNIAESTLNTEQSTESSEESFEMLGIGELTHAQLQSAVLDLNTVPEAMESMSAIEEKGHVNRLYEQEADLNTVILQNRNGGKTKYIFSSPVKYIDSDGSIKDKSTDLTQKSGVYSYAAENNNIRSYFGNSVTNGVKVTYGDYEVELYLDNVAAAVSGTKVSNASIPGDNKEKDRIMYAINAKTLLCYTPRLSGLKEDIILASYSGLNSFSFTYITNGLSVISNDKGGAYLVDTAGNVVGELGKILCYDSGRRRAAGSMTVTEVVPNDQYTVTVTAPIDFLTDPDTQYPVSIDPAVVLYEEDLGETTYRFIQNIGMYDTEETGDYLNEYMFPLGAGEYDVSGDKTRMLYSFTDDFYTSALTDNIPHDIATHQLASATLYVYTETGYELKTVAASAYWEDWPATVTEGLYYCDDSEIFDAYEDEYINFTTVPAGTADVVGYDITSVVLEWFYDDPQNSWIKGIMLRLYNNESNDSDGSYIDLELTGYGCFTSVSFDYSEYKSSSNYITASTGEFLYYSGTTPASNIYSNSAAKKWGLVYVGAYKYYLYLTGVGYLTASEDGSVYFASRDYDDEDGTQRWEIYGGGIRNIYTGMYLCKDSTGIRLSSSGPYSDGNARWTIYHSSEYVPLTDFELEDDWIPVNVAKTLAIVTTPSNATHSVNSSFTWSESSSAFSLSSTSLGQVLSGSTVGVAYLTVTHNATGITKSLRIYRGAIREGTYMFRNRGTGRYMHIQGGSTSSGAYIQQWTYHTSPHAKWNISMLAGGYYVIQSVHSGLYFRTEGGSSSSNAKIIQFDQRYSTGGYWRIESTTNGAYKIVPTLVSTFAISAPVNGDTTNGLNVVQTTYTSDTNYLDEWYIDNGAQTHGIDDGMVYNIRVNNGGNKYLTVAGESDATSSGGGLADGTNINQHTLVPGCQWQRWQLNYISEGHYKIKDMNSGKLLSVENDSISAQANIRLETDENTSGQLFKIRENADGSYSFLSKSSDYRMVLDISNYSKQDGANLEQYYDNGTTNQKFVLVKSNKAIIIVPGILGSELFVGEDNPYFYEGMPIFSEEVLSALEQYESQAQQDPDFFAFLPEEIRELIRELVDVKEFANGVYDSLECNENGNSEYDLYVKEFRLQTPDSAQSNNIYTSRVGMCNAYSEIYNSLYTKFSDLGYVVDFFSYDWRFSNGATAQLLDDYIEKYGYNEVIFVSHSMGGLVTSAYLSLGEEQRQKVDKVFFAASPLLGAAETLNVVFNGDLGFLTYTHNGTTIKIGNILRIIVEEILLTDNDKCLQALLCNYRSIYELFPSSHYYDYFESYLTYVDTTHLITTTDVCLSNSDVRNALDECFAFYNDNLMILAETFHASCFTDTGAHISTLVDSYYLCAVGKYTTFGFTLTRDSTILSCEGGSTITLVANGRQISGDGLVLQNSATINLNINHSKVFCLEGGHMSPVERDDFFDYINEKIST